MGLASFGGAAASGYQDAEGNTVNENQEMADDWWAKDRSMFKFFKAKYTFLSRDKEQHWFCAAKLSDYLVGYWHENYWLLVHGSKQKKDDAGNDIGGKFNGAP